MESPSLDWAREMSRAASGSLVVYDDGKVRESYAPGTWRTVSEIRALPAPASPAWDCALIAELNPHLGSLRVRLDPRIDAVLVMDESTDMGLIVTRRTVEELGGLRAALAVGINRLLSARSWPAESRVALGGR